MVKMGLRYGLLLFMASLLISSPVYAGWEKVESPSVSSNWRLSGVKFTSSDGWAVGKDIANGKGVLLHFVDGQWGSVPPPDISTDWGLEAVDFVSPTEGWAVGTDAANHAGLILHFTNNSWSLANLPFLANTNWNFHGVHFISASEGWAVGEDQNNSQAIALHFLNGTWSVANLPIVSTDWMLNGVHFRSSTEGWAVGKDLVASRGVLLHFTESLWQSVDPPDISTDWGLASIDFPSPNEGWTVGQDNFNQEGVALHFLNGQWTEENLPAASSDWALFAVHFLSVNEGWAVGKDFFGKQGVLLHFLNDVWESVGPPDVSSNWDLSGVQFLSPIEGWAVGQDNENKQGVLLRYGTPVISVSPVEVRFGEVSVGAYLEKRVQVKNAGSEDLLINSVTPPDLPFVLRVDGCTGKILLPKQTCSLAYRLAPATEGTFNSSSDIPSNDPKQEIVTVNLRGTGILGPSTFIHLLSPMEGEEFSACSYFSPPTFQWNPSESFKAVEVDFSLKDDFSSVPVFAKGKSGSTQLLISSLLWKKVLLLPGPEGGTVYWKVTGTRNDNTKVDSEVFSIGIEGPQSVLNPQITSGPTPTLSWENNCNVQFRAWFGNNPDFSQKGVKKKALTFSVKNPSDQGGVFSVTLSAKKWASVRKIVGNGTGYWYVESWDKMKRRSQTEVMPF